MHYGWLEGRDNPGYKDRSFKNFLKVRIPASFCACIHSNEWISFCSGIIEPDTHLGENARDTDVSDDQPTSYLNPRVQA